MIERDERRQRATRMKARVRRYFACDTNGPGPDRRARPTTDSRRIGKVARTRHACSCIGCMNPRRRAIGNSKDRLTMQERRALSPYDSDE